ncbi:homoserine O-acetyltransferase [Halteromyces radiatus]|uniref:homoserine O-acetyltransferase n=1 Tax=Halteromyces radiatus TaxID=101107 RepID=UPI0022208BAC|nr:homoserine O-acetyltransferase [Halteromyces radiatus]KAI8097041.1 homoserine O-acetyltransferase [Halteromyces radiatus]
MFKSYKTTEGLPMPVQKNKLVNLIADQNITIIPEFTLETGVVLKDVPVAWKSWGKLNDNGDNCMVICHALTGSADVEDWWGPLMGPRKAFDTTKFFIVCCNVMGSPYGSASPLTIHKETGERYGPEFPLASIRDDVRLHRLILDQLGVKQVAICIGGSMGGMQVLEWAFMGKDYVRTIVPIATSGRHSAWGISWGEAQRQSIYSDPFYVDGYYPDDQPPSVGLSAARMSALLTYRSRDSFESRFGRKSADAKKYRNQVSPSSPREANRMIHNDGHKNTSCPPLSPPLKTKINGDEGNGHPVATINDPPMPTPFVFSAQSYLRYQGDKFIGRFDANCYIALTRKMDTHDLSRGRGDYDTVLTTIQQPTLVIGIESDGLFTISEQYELADGIPGAEMIVIQSSDGHDGFLLEFDQINRHILKFEKDVLPDIYDKSVVSLEEAEKEEELKATKTSLFGEAEVDITQW